MYLACETVKAEQIKTSLEFFFFLHSESDETLEPIPQKCCEGAEKNDLQKFLTACNSG